MVKKRLTVFHTESIYLRGGEKYLFELLKRLSQKYVITLYTERISPYWRQNFIKHDIKVKTLWRPSHLYWLMLPVTLVINYLRLRRQITSNEVILSTNFPVNLLSILLSKKTLCHCFEPMVIFYDSIRINTLPFKSKIFVKIAKFLYSGLDKFAINHCYYLTTLNPAVEKYILAVHGRKPNKFIPNGIDTKMFTPLWHRKKRNNLVLLHSTDYTVLKGTENFLQALPLIIKRHPNTHVYISESMHNAKERKKYEQIILSFHIKPFVNFMGTVSEVKLPDFYRSGDLFCYTGSHLCAGGATASLSVLESQACGTPVIRSMGNKEEVINWKTGYVINPYNPNEIARAVDSFCRLSEPKKLAMKKAAQQHVTQHFSWDKSSHRLSRLIDSLYEKRI